MFEATSYTRRKERTEIVARTIFLAMTLMMVVPLVLIVGYLIVQAWPILSIDFLITNPRNGMRAGGIWSPLLGTIYLVVISLVIATPIGVLAAVFLNEYAKDNWLTRVIHLAVVNLAGVPSIVHALFGLGAFVLFAGLGKSVLAASLTLAIMTLPVIIASTKEALSSVPMSFREACWNVGATRWQTIQHVVLPNSIGGILTGVILQVSRAAGETAPIMFTGAVFYKAIDEGDIFAYGFFDQCMALSMHLFTISTQVPEVPKALPYGTAVVLLGSVLVVNALAIFVRFPAEVASQMVNGGNMLEIANLCVHYGKQQVLRNVTFDVHRNEVLGVIGPAQSGKTTLLRCINRTIDNIPDAGFTGTIKVDGEDVRRVKDLPALRRKIGMVAPLPVGLPLSIFDNVAFAPRMAGIRDRTDLDERVERCLRQAALWDEVKDRLNGLGTLLSGGQQQRLTIARALSHDPEILCLDEFSIAIDPVTTMRIEDVLKELRSKITIILVTNLVQQARRLATRTAFFLNGELVELAATETIFSETPADPRTFQYVRGIFG